MDYEKLKDRCCDSQECDAKKINPELDILAHKEFDEWKKRLIGLLEKSDATTDEKLNKMNADEICDQALEIMTYKLTLKAIQNSIESLEFPHWITPQNILRETFAMVENKMED